MKVRKGPEYHFWKEISSYTVFNNKRKELEKRYELEKNSEKKEEI